MRTSKKQQILARSLELIATKGLAALNYEQLSAVTGLTRSGLTYHFPTRDDLLQELGHFLLQSWQNDFHAALPVPLAKASTAQRLQALITTMLNSKIAAGEFVLLTQAGSLGVQLNDAWENWMLEIIGPRTELTIGQQAALLAADGWWLNQAILPDKAAPPDPILVNLLHQLAADNAL